MLTHLNASREVPDRTVVIGAKGFVGGAITRKLRQQSAPVLELSREDLDLLAPDAGAALASMLRPSDAVVCASAIAPVKSPAMLRDNIRIIETLRDAFARQPVTHVVNIGSDAIYGDTLDLIDESFDAAPTSLHGIMHLTRELVLGEVCAEIPFMTLRPTLIYGTDDPHNGYGPNRFRRLAASGSEITLFGEGEEQRDHVRIEDVAELALRCLLWRSRGSLNAATGVVVSFRRVAELIGSQFPKPVPIHSSERTGPMPHNGYRAFDPSATLKAFPDFRYTAPEQGFAALCEGETQAP